MALNKLYSRINWENDPSDKTPLNEDNLNKMDAAINELDDRIITQDTTKLDKTTAYTMVKTISYEKGTGIFTVTLLNGSSFTLDTKLEKLAINWRYDSENQKLIITLDDGTEQEVDLSALITQYEFLNSGTISFSIGPDGKVSADIINGSVTPEKLRPDYLADIKVESAKAEASATAASTSEINSKSSENAAKESEEKAKMYAEQAKEVTGIGIATQTTAGILKGGDNYIAEDGTLQLTKQTTDPTLYNSYAGGIKVNEIDGKSEQFSGTITDERGNEIEVPSPDYPQEIDSVGGSSINMFNIDGEDYIAGYYPNNTGGFSASSAGNNAYIVKVRPNTTYSISRQVYEGISTCRINAYSEYPTISSVGSVLVGMDLNTLSYVFTTLADTEYIAFYCNQTGSNQGARLAHIMINEGDIPLPYVPYGVTISLRTHGKNLFDGRWRQGNSSDITQTNYVTSVTAIPCKIGDVFSVSCKGMRVALIMLSRQAYINPEGVIQSTGFVNGSATITCQHDGFLKIQMQKSNTTNALTPVEAQSMEVMWNKGESIQYEPYQESVAYLSETLRGIGDVKDRIVRKDGVWGVERNVAEIASYNGESITTEYISTTGGLDTGATVDYVLAATTFEPLPEADQIALHTLQSYDTVTYISCDSEVEPTIDVEYGTSRVGGYTLEAWNTSKRNEINNAQLNSAILSLGGNV